MDWAKAKTVLIVAFVITNLFLGYNLYSYNTKYKKSESIYEDKTFLNNFYSVLKEKNISIDCDIPKQMPRLSKISVRYESFTNEDLKDYRLNNGNIQIIDGKKIIYKAKVNLSQFNETQALKYSENFLKSLDYKKESMLKYVKTTSENIEVYYTSKYEKYFLEKSYMKYVYSKNGDFYFERLWLVPVNRDDNPKNSQKRRVINSIEAILSIYSELEPNSHIKEIKLGYCIDNKNTTNIQNAKSATAFPTWRIKIDDKYYYIEAFDF